MPLLSDGTFGSSQVAAGRLLREYMELVEKRQWERLLHEMDVNTDGPRSANAHPNAVLFAAVQVLAAVALQTGSRSAVPFIDSYVSTLEGKKDERSALWTPGN